ncbi:MAG: energy transducer TonB [Opitutaceae bacterium]|nr:energy transducer TonB [Opitutaceae bacterium]
MLWCPAQIHVGRGDGGQGGVRPVPHRRFLELAHFHRGDRLALETSTSKLARLNSIPQFHRGVFAALGIFATLTSALVGQNVLVTEHAKKPYQVVNMRGMQPFVSVEGQVVAATGTRFALVPVEEYAPVLISVRDAKVIIRGTRNTAAAVLELPEEGRKPANALLFSAKFESSYRLENVFLVVEMDFGAVMDLAAAMDSDAVGKEFFPWEVGTLKPHDPKPISLNVSLADHPDEGKFKLHIFVGGREAFNSEMPPGDRAKKLDLMVAKRIKGQRDAIPRPFFGPAPEYPVHLLPAQARGEAVVAIRITAKGVVEDSVVKSATDPAFGEAAITAIRQWRFLPLVKDGQATETTVVMPFVFPAPKASPGKS